MIKKVNKRLFLIVLLGVFTLIGLTLSFFVWQSNEQIDFTLTVGEFATVTYTSGNNISESNIGPIMDYNQGNGSFFDIKRNTNVLVSADVFITPTELPDELKEESFKCVLLRSNDNVTWDEVAQINFLDKSINNEYIISSNINLIMGHNYFKIIMYIDGNQENPSDMMGKSFEAKINAVAYEVPYTDESNANYPELVDGMIPVMYADGNWVKADIYNKDKKYSGYDYANKKWANAVMVKENSGAEENSKTRSDYILAKPGTLVAESDILAHFVWIPRYKYEIFNINYSEAIYADNTCTLNCPKEINIVFENNIESTGTVTCPYQATKDQCVDSVNSSITNNISTYTHPAFWFDKNSDGISTADEQLRGIWVGKFETSADINSDCYLNESIDNCNSSNFMPRILPNVYSLRYQYLNNQNLTSQKFGSNTYLTENSSNSVDSHIMKNFEWGAVTYLMNSKYGLCDGDGNCNPSGFNNYIEGASSISMTGCGALYGISPNTSCNLYNSSGVVASTTNNVTGIYDMSGGNLDVVMANYNNMMGSSNINVGTFDRKYIDVYYGNTINDSYLGDALGEVNGWNHNQKFISSTDPWFARGGRGNSTNPGLMSFDGSIGNNIKYLPYISFHVVLVNLQ